MKRLEIVNNQQNFGLIGALIGGYLGKKFLKKKVGSVAGALIGGAIGHYGQRALDKATKDNFSVLNPVLKLMKARNTAVAIKEAGLTSTKRVSKVKTATSVSAAYGGAKTVDEVIPDSDYK